MTCRADSPKACPWRYEAVRRDEMRYGEHVRAWVWFASPLLVFTVAHCPGCGGGLPTPATMAGKWAVGDFGEGDE